MDIRHHPRADNGQGRERRVQYNLSGEDFAPGGQFHMPEIPPQTVRTLIGVGIGLACVITALFAASVVARYVAETALIRMVDDYQASGQKQSIGQGFRLGWSRVAWRLFLIDLLIFLPVAFGLGLVFAAALAPLLLWTTDSTAAGAVGTVATIGRTSLTLLLAFGRMLFCKPRRSKRQGFPSAITLPARHSSARLCISSVAAVASPTTSQNSVTE